MKDKLIYFFLLYITYQKKKLNYAGLGNDNMEESFLHKTEKNLHRVSLTGHNFKLVNSLIKLKDS